jgi:hypothetical protein
MRRREFIAGLGGSAALPLVVRAQQAAVPGDWVIELHAHGVCSPRREGNGERI